MPQRSSKVSRRKTILNAFEQLALQATVALLTVPFAVAPSLRFTYVTGPPFVMVAVPPLIHDLRADGERLRGE